MLDNTRPTAGQTTVLGAIWRHRFAFTAVVIATMMLALVASELRSPGYVATASLVIRAPVTSSDGTSSDQTTNPQRYIADQVVILRLRAVADRAAELVNEDLAALSRGEDPDAPPPTTTTTLLPPDESTPTVTSIAPTTTLPATNLPKYAPLTADHIAAGLTVTNRSDANVVEVSFSASDPVVAARAANAVVNAYEEVRRSQARDATLSAAAQLDSSIIATNEELAAVDQALDQIRTSTPGRLALDAQYARIVEALADIGETALAQPGGPLSQTVQNLVTQLNALQTVQQVERGRPEVSDLYAKRDQLTARRAALESRRDQVALEAESITSDIVFSSPAQIPVAPSGLGHVRFGILGLILGVIPAAALAYVLATRRRSIANATEPAQILGVPLLAEIPNFRHERTGRLPVLNAPQTQAAESFRFLATSLAMRRRGTEATVFAIVSPTSGDGKSVVAANLSMALATRGDLLAIDADLEGQGLTHLVHPDGITVGLRDVLSGSIPLTDALGNIASVGASDFKLLAGGEHASAVRDLIDSPATRDLFSIARLDFDMIVVDLPPLLSMAYAASVLRWVDGVVVVVPMGTSHERLRQLNDRLKLIDAPVVGYVLNGARLRSGSGPSKTASREDTHARANGSNGRAWMGRPLTSR
jgi:Mrp family chromosome partitioning ATPase